MRSLKRFLKDESGATMIEYGLLAGLISVVAIVAVTASGTAVNEIFVAVQGALEGATP